MRFAPACAKRTSLTADFDILSSWRFSPTVASVRKSSSANDGPQRLGPPDIDLHYLLFSFFYFAGVPTHEFHLATNRRVIRAARYPQLHALSRLPRPRRRLLRLGCRGQSLSR